LERIKLLQTFWADQAVSNTVYYKYLKDKETGEIIESDLPRIKEWLKANYNDNVKTVSFLMHSGHGFEQAVLQPITKEQYQEAIKEIQLIDIKEASNELLDSQECRSGVCPVR
jgi:hypothetical protein